MNLKIEDFNRIGDRVPLIANLKPHGKVSYIFNVNSKRFHCFRPLLQRPVSEKDQTLLVKNVGLLYKNVWLFGHVTNNV